MKKSLIALSLSLLASQGLFAEYHDGASAQSQPSNGSCASNCCKPCCTPKPRPCIDCECYVPSWYDLQCDWGAFLTVDFLYWYGREKNLPYATKLLIQDGTVDAAGAVQTSIAGPSSTSYMNTAWDPGVRVGLGWNTDCDGWDVYFEWTGYWNSKKSSTSVETFTDEFPAAGVNVLRAISIFPEDAVSADSATFYDKVSGNWKFDFNRFDLQFGKRYWLSKQFTLRPFGGIGGIWTETNWTVTASPIVLGEYTQSGQAKYRNRNWGAGLIGGLEPTFQFNECFGLYADIGMGLYYGRSKNSQSGTTAAINSGTVDPSLDYSFSERDSHYGMFPVLDLGIGLRWESFWCERQYHFAFDLGWEHHTLFDHNDRHQFESALLSNGNAYVKNVNTKTNDVDLGGLVLKVRFDF